MTKGDKDSSCHWFCSCSRVTAVAVPFQSQAETKPPFVTKQKPTVRKVIQPTVPRWLAIEAVTSSEVFPVTEVIIETHSLAITTICVHSQTDRQAIILLTSQHQMAPGEKNNRSWKKFSLDVSTDLENHRSI